MNKTFTKADAIKLVSLSTNQTQAIVKSVIDAFFSEVKDALRMDRKVEIRGFGVLETRISKARVGRNPSKPDSSSFTIPPKRTVRFRMAGEFRDEIAQQKPVRKVVTAEPINDVT